MAIHEDELKADWTWSN